MTTGVESARAAFAVPLTTATPRTASAAGGIEDPDSAERVYFSPQAAALRLVLDSCKLQSAARSSGGRPDEHATNDPDHSSSLRRSAPPGLNVLA
ncbi:MAG: hypothetical protein CHACPFDD_02647 [Phycisphaerae bacterium]|nr:hypothetical protein [Phycisphaerae bacterium]